MGEVKEEDEKNGPIHSPEPYYQDGEIDLRELFCIIWAGKWVIILMTFAFAVGGVTYALQKPDIYQASALLAPTEEDSRPKLGGQLQGLANLAGVNLGAEGSRKTVIAKEVLQSRAFLSDFIRRHGLAVPLLGTAGWDMRENEWIYNTEIFDPDTSKWKVDDSEHSLKPTDWDLVNKFRNEHLTVSENEENGMVTVSVVSQSPVAAKQWVDWIIHDINEHMRNQHIEEAEARIQYLKKKLTETDIAGMQKVFYQLIESETRAVMLASVRQEYVFRTIDPAVVPQEKSGPKRGFIAMVSTMLGFMLGVFVLLIRAVLRKSDQGDINKLATTKIQKDLQEQ
ncbi:MAG: Wzz/FepE/Etk N-terminal domain-containing protein [Ketobacteraceae bacterium]|nr:Wzz/FepE/Etk N-terminal domain-containing protein [Ketobacteraceae bacterium]